MSSSQPYNKAEASSEHIALQKSKSRRTLILVLAVFIIPVILAKLALSEHWFNYGVTNKGKLVEHEITLEKMGLASADFEKKWLMIYLLPSHCEQLCKQTLHGVDNTYVALGKEMDRVQPVILAHHDLTAEQRQQFQENRWSVKATPALTKQLFKEQQVLIVDTLGNIVLSYTPPDNDQSLPLFGKSILADFKKLLKYSKIG